jgi:hypothetical protein
MIDDPDIFRCAKLLNGQHGEDAPIRATERAGELLEAGDGRWSCAPNCRSRGIEWLNQFLSGSAKGLAYANLPADTGSGRSRTPSLPQDFDVI